MVSLCKRCKREDSYELHKKYPDDKVSACTHYKSRYDGKLLKHIFPSR